jgi:hypothetical protein
VEPFAHELSQIAFVTIREAAAQTVEEERSRQLGQLERLLQPRLGRHPGERPQTGPVIGWPHVFHVSSIDGRSAPQ